MLLDNTDFEVKVEKYRYFERKAKYSIFYCIFLIHKIILL